MFSIVAITMYMHSTGVISSSGEGDQPLFPVSEFLSEKPLCTVAFLIISRSMGVTCTLQLHYDMGYCNPGSPPGITPCHNYFGQRLGKLTHHHAPHRGIIFWQDG